MKFAELYQDDPRDRTIFVEHYPNFVLTSVWNDEGRLITYAVVDRILVA